MEGREGALEQPEFSTDPRDNGRLLVIVSALTESALSLAKRVVGQLRNLPPFMIPDNREAAVSLRVLASVPSWARDKNKRELFLHRSKLVTCFVGVATCQDADELTNATSLYKREVSQMGKKVLSTFCVVFGEESRLGAQLRGVKGDVLLLDQTSSALGEEDEERADLQASRLSQLLFKCLGQSLSQLTAMLHKEEDHSHSIAKKLEGSLTVADEEVQRWVPVINSPLVMKKQCYYSRLVLYPKSSFFR